MSLLSLIEELGKVETVPVPLLDPARCLHRRDRSHSCTACGDACPVGAIVFSEEIPRLDAEQCQRCLACLAACPAGAFTSPDAVPDLVRCAGHMPADHLEVVCCLHRERQRGPGKAAIRVQECLAGLGAAAYLALAVRGVLALTVRADSCEGCSWGGLLPQVVAQVAEAQGLLALWENPMRLLLTSQDDPAWQERPCYPATSPPFNRRALVELAREGREEPVVGGERPFQQRLRTVRNLQALPPLAEAKRKQRLPAAARFALVYVNERCSACGTCSRACPTGALEMALVQDHFQLTLAPQACVACDVCAPLPGRGNPRPPRAARWGHFWRAPPLPIVRGSGPALRALQCLFFPPCRPQRGLL